MTQLSLSADELLTTTRAVRRRLDFDRPLAFELVRECIATAVQAPTGSLAEQWQFVLVDDPDKRRALAALYARAWPIYVEQPWSIYNLHRDDAAMKPIADRAGASAEYLVENMHRAPWLLVPLLRGRYESAAVEIAAAVYGSILPAVWSFMLAARARGLGTCWTTGHLMFEREAAGILGIPYEEFTQVALVPVAYTIGTGFKPAPRKDLDQFIHVNGWRGD